MCTYICMVLIARTSEPKEHTESGGEVQAVIKTTAVTHEQQENFEAHNQ